MKIATNRLRDNLLFRVLPPMFVVMIISGVIGYFQAYSFVNASYDRSLLEEARGLAQQVQLVGSDARLDMPAAAVEMLRADTSDRIYYQVRVVGRGVVAGDTVLPEPPREDLYRSVYYYTRVQGEKVRVVVVPLQFEAGGKPVMVQYGETLHKRNSLANEMVVGVLAPQAMLVILAWVALRRGVYVGLRPLEILARSITKRSPDDLAPLPVSNVPEEVLPLLSAFNSLLQSLDNAAAAQKRFVADAAHQLRTPLAALRIQLERALRETDAELRESLFQQLVGAVDRTARLSSQLLMLARAEPGAHKPGTAPVDLCALAFSTGSTWIHRTIHLGADLGLEAPDKPLYVVGEPIMLGELVNNLIDNALRYGGKRITLEVREVGDEIELSVEDDGAGVAPEEEVRIFERFYRARASAGEGSGLGLAIVREIAHRFGAEAAYRRGEAGGACFYIRFRRVPTPAPETNPPPSMSHG